MEDKEIQGQQNQKQGQQEEQDAMGKHPLENSAFDGTGGSVLLPPPPLFGPVGGHYIVANQVHIKLKAFENLSGEDPDVVIKMLEGIGQDQLPAFHKAYYEIAGRDFLDHFHETYNWVLRSGRDGGKYYQRVGKHFTPNPLSSNAAPGEHGAFHQPAHDDLLPRNDVKREAGDGSPEGIPQVRIDVPGKYVVEGQSVTVLLDQPKKYAIHGESNGKKDTVELISVQVGDDAGKVVPHVQIAREYTEKSYLQKIETTPRKSGNYHLTFWLRHPDGSVEIIRRSMPVKPASEVSKEALGNVSQIGYDDMMTNLEEKRQELEGGISADQHTAAKAAGQPFIIPDQPGAVRLQPWMTNLDAPRIRYKVHGMGEGDNRIQWYVRMTYKKGSPVAKFGGRGEYPISQDSRPWTQSGDNVRVYSLEEGGTEISTRVYEAEKYAFIAEERGPDGKPTGKTAVYQQVVLNSTEVKDLERVEKHIEEAKEMMGLIQEGGEVPVKAAYTQNENGSSVAVTFFIGKSKNPNDKYAYRMVDMTPGVDRREYMGNTVEECIADFKSNNIYPPGHVTFEVEGNDKGVKSGVFSSSTDGTSTKQKMSSTAGWASLGFAVAGIAAASNPVTAGASPFLFGAAGVTGAVSGVTSYLDRRRQTETDYLGIAVDITTVVTSTMNLGAIGISKLLKDPKKIITTGTGRFFILGASNLEKVEAVMISVQAGEQLLSILDADMPAVEKRYLLATWISNMLMTGMMMKMAKAAFKAHPTIDTLPSKSKEEFGKLNEKYQQWILDLTNDRGSGLTGPEMGKRYDEVLQYWSGQIEAGQLNHKGLMKRIHRLRDTVAWRKELMDTLGEAEYKNMRLPSANFAQGSFSLRFGKELSTVIDGERVVKTLNLRERVAFGKTHSISGGNKPNKVLGEIQKDMKLKDKMLHPKLKRELAPPVRHEHVHDPVTRKKRIEDRGVFKVKEGHHNDSERKITEDLVRKIELKIRKHLGRDDFDITRHEIPDGIKGKVTLFSEMLPCSSCTKIIKEQWPDLFGDKIKLEVINGLSYGEKGHTK